MQLKSIITVFFIISSFVIEAQITDLQKISKGRFYDSDIIRDQNNNIKGYFLLFETDKVAKETVELEYVVLDENLTKVTNGFITEMKFESLLIKSKRIKCSVTLNKDKLLLRLSDEINGGMANEAYLRYRILDLKTNELSDLFLFNKNELKLNPSIDRKMKNYVDNFSQEMYFFNDIGLVVDAKDRDDKTKVETRYISSFDDNYKELWKYKYDINENRENKKQITYLKSNKDVIVFFNHTTDKNYSYINDYSLIFLNSKTGKLISEFSFPNVDKNAYKVVDCFIKDKEITILGNYSNKSYYGHINDDENKGLFNFTFSKETGKLIKSNYLNWEDLSSKLDINKNGFIKKEGYIFIHNMLPLDNEKMIVVCETFEQSPIKTNNMYFLELTKDFKLNQVFQVDKFRNKFPRTDAHSNDIKRYGLFDFIDYHDLGDDEFLFFLNDNEKNTTNRKKSTLYGIVSYSEGVFKKQILDLKTETSSISIFPSKKGYIMFIEDFDLKAKPTELRLEKVNY